MNSSNRNAGPRIICGLIKLDYTDSPTTTTMMTTETTAITSEPTSITSEQTTITSEQTTESNPTTITTA